MFEAISEPVGRRRDDGRGPFRGGIRGGSPHSSETDAGEEDDWGWFLGVDPARATATRLDLDGGDGQDDGRESDAVRRTSPGFAALDAEDDEAIRVAWLNNRVRAFAEVMRASLSRATCVASEDDLHAECTTLIDRLQRFVAEGGRDGSPSEA